MPKKKNENKEKTETKKNKINFEEFVSLELKNKFKALNLDFDPADLKFKLKENTFVDGFPEMDDLGEYLSRTDKRHGSRPRIIFSMALNPFYKDIAGDIFSKTYIFDDGKVRRNSVARFYSEKALKKIAKISGYDLQIIKKDKKLLEVAVLYAEPKKENEDS